MRAHARFARDCVPADDLALRAHHWWEALRPPDAEWVWSGDADVPAMRNEAYAAHLAAGRKHAEHFAIDRAIELLERGLSFADDDRARAAAEQAIGGAYRRILRQDESWRHLLRSLELYRAVGPVPVPLYGELVNTAQFLGAFRVRPDPATVEALAAEGTAAASAAGDLATLARILRSHGQYVINLDETDPDRAEPLMEGAVKAAESSGDPDVLRQTLLTRAATLAREGRAEEAGTILARVEGALAGADALERLSHLMSVSRYHLLMARLGPAEEAALAATDLASPMGPHLRTHAWRDLADVYMARGDRAKLIDLAHRAADLMTTEKASAFCRNGAAILRNGAVAQALAGQREETVRLIRAMPTTDIELDLVAAAPRALLGFASPETDLALQRKNWAWWEWEEAVYRALVLGRPDAAEAALARMGRVNALSPAYRAFAESAREAIAELRGGPPATYEALRRIGYVGWIELMRKRVTAEY
jgi:tetratricopeptide (TPR) repeat protein